MQRQGSAHTDVILARPPSPKVSPKEESDETELLINPDFLYTQSVEKPTKVYKQLRFIVRAAQLLFSCASFSALAVSTVQINYSYAVLGTSGVNFMCLVSLSSLFVSSSCMVLYLYPSFLGVPPHRYWRFSRIEVTVDLLYIGFWIASSSTVALFNNCPRSLLKIFTTNSDPTSAESIQAQSCLPWNMCFAFGYGTAALFFFTFVIGCRDLWFHGWFSANKHIGTSTFQGARGNWKHLTEKSGSTKLDKK